MNSPEYSRSLDATRKAEAWQKSAEASMGVRVNVDEDSFREQESDPRLRESFVMASKLIMSLTMPEREMHELEANDELFTEKGMTAFNESIAEREEVGVRDAIKSLRTEVALFGGQEAPFHGSLPAGSLSYTDTLAQEFYAEAYGDDALSQKQSLLLHALGVFYDKEAIAQSQQEMGLYLVAASSDQILIDKGRGYGNYASDREMLSLETIRNRGINTQQLTRGEKRYIDPKYPMLTEEEVRERLGLEESGALHAVVRVGHPKNGVTFGIFGREDEEVFHLHYLVGTSDAESGVSDADRIRYAASPYDDLRGGGFIGDSFPLDELGVAKIGSAIEDNSAVEGMLKGAHDALKQSSLLTGKLTVEPRHVTVRLEKKNGKSYVVVRDIRSGDSMGATLVQSRSLGEHDNNPMRRGVRSTELGKQALGASSFY